MSDYRHRNPSLIGESLERLVRNLGAPPISVITQLEDRWPELVGPALAGITSPSTLVAGCLTIRCDDTTAASQITWMESQIKANFESHFGPNLVSKIVTKATRS